MTNNENLQIYIDQIISQGSEEIDKLTCTDNIISIKLAENIRDFKYQEIKKIDECKTALMLFLDKENQINGLSQKLEIYESNVLNFDSNYKIQS